MILQLLMMHQYTKFGSERVTGSHESLWTNIQWHSEPLLGPWPWTQQSNLLTRKSSFWWCTINISLIQWLSKDWQFRKYSRHRHTLITWAFTLTFTLKKTNQIFLHDTLANEYDAPSEKIQCFRCYLNKTLTSRAVSYHGLFDVLVLSSTVSIRKCYMYCVIGYTEKRTCSVTLYQNNRTVSSKILS